MDILKQIINLLIGLFSEEKEKVKLSAKKRAINSLEKVADDHYKFELSGVWFEIKPDSWNLARSDNKTIHDVLNFLKKKSFKVLDLIAKQFSSSIKTIGLSSLWRPGDPDRNVHAAGRGVDLGYIILDGGTKLMTRPNKREQPIMANLRNFTFDTGLIWQWIGPNKIRFSKGSNWINNNGSEGLHEDHQDHIHLTVST